MRTAVVVGGGSWGTGFSRFLADHGLEVTIATHREEDAASIRETGRNPRFMTEVDLSDVAATTIAEAPVADADLVVVAVPSEAFRAVVESLPSTSPILSLTKGLDPATGDLVHPRQRPSRRRPVRAQHGRRGRGGAPGCDRDCQRGRRLRTPAPGDDQLGRLSRLSERRPRRGRAVRRGEERDRARRGRLRRHRRGRQSNGSADHARAGRDASLGGPRARSRHVLPGLPGWAT